MSWACDRPFPARVHRVKLTKSLKASTRVWILYPDVPVSLRLLELPVACPEECQERGGQCGDCGRFCYRLPRGFSFRVTAIPRACLRVSARTLTCRPRPPAQVASMGPGLYPLELLSTDELTPTPTPTSFVLKANLAGTDRQGFLRYSLKLSSE